jgi:hypothetical protein
MKPSVSPDRSGLPAIFILRTSRAAVVICTTCSLPNAFKASDTHLTAACITTYRFLLYNHRDCRDTQSTSYFATFDSHTYFTSAHDFVIWSSAAFCIYDTRP